MHALYSTKHFRDKYLQIGLLQKFTEGYSGHIIVGSIHTYCVVSKVSVCFTSYFYILFTSLQHSVASVKTTSQIQEPVCWLKL